MATPNDFLPQVLGWLRAGYPTGIPHTDYLALLGVLHRRLTDEEFATIAHELAGASDGSAAVDEDAIRELVRRRAFLGAPPEDVTRVSARLAEVGWPLAGRTLVLDEDLDEPPAEGSVLARIIGWLREGYPLGVPEQDYIPLLALLKRRLTDAEVKKVAKALRKADVTPAGPEDIAEFITRVTHEQPSMSDLTRVRDRLTKKGWPVEFPDPDQG